MTSTADIILAVAKAEIRGTREGATVTIDRADTVAWLRRCAVESGDGIPGRVCEELATALENMKVKAI